MDFIFGGFMENAIINEKLFMQVAFIHGGGQLFVKEKYILEKNGNFSLSKLSTESHMGQIFTSSNQKQCNVKFVYIA